MSSPEYGPSGYLPPKAAKRARKIVLREQMGWGWPLAAMAAALVVVIAGVLFLRGFTRPPGEPFVAAGPVTDVAPGGAAVMQAGETPVVVLRTGGGVRVFAAQNETTVWCAETQRLESPDSAWRSDGTRTFGSGDSLRPMDSVVFDGLVYVDVATEHEPLPTAPSSQPPACLHMG